ncbi:uncharacterized protein LOC143301945 isoform X2 [Babylonia areolata]
MDLGPEGEDEEKKNDRRLIRRPPPSDPDKWNALPEVPTWSEIGYLHLSFEYHKGALRIRVWQISDLLLPPPQISMIHSLFVRGYFIPDKVKKTMRRTEEVLVEVPDKNGVDTAATGIQHIFTPSSFKFRTALLYTGLTAAIIRERGVQLEVCMTQKATRRVFLMAMVHMPLRTALRRPIREKYPLIPCLNLTTPNSMRVYSATLLPHVKGGHSVGPERKGGQAEGVSGRGEAELEDDVSLSGEDFLRSHLSLCLDHDSDDDSLRTSGTGTMMTSQTSNGAGSGASSSSSNTLNNASFGEDGEDDRYDDIGDDEDDEVRSDEGEAMARSTPLDGSLQATGDTPVSRKKIIPDELSLGDSGESNTNMPVEEGGVVNGVPSGKQRRTVLCLQTPLILQRLTLRVRTVLHLLTRMCYLHNTRTVVCPHTPTVDAEKSFQVLTWTFLECQQKRMAKKSVYERKNCHWLIHLRSVHWIVLPSRMVNVEFLLKTVATQLVRYLTPRTSTRMISLQENLLKLTV